MIPSALPQGPRHPLRLLAGLLFQKDYTLWNFLEANRQRYGDVCRLPIPLHATTYQVTDPDLIGRILMGTEKTNFKSVFFERMKKIAGNGLILSGGETWRVNRRLANPAFHPRMLDRMREIIEAEVELLLQDWDQRVDRDPIVNISEEMSKLLLNIIVKILFSSDFKKQAAVINEAMIVFQEYSSYIYYNPIDLPLWIPTPLHLRLRKVIRVFDEITYAVIDEHRRHPERYQDLLSVYLGAKDEETGQTMSDQQLRDEVLALVLAGHETTAATLSMGLHALTRENPVVEKMLAEYQTPGQMTYTNLVQQEILRLYPAIWGISRVISEDLEFKGVTYPKGTIFLLVQQLMHRHPEHWRDPASFRPERFLKEESEGRHPFAYFPFGGGARNCIGMGLAKMEINIVLSRFLQRFRFEPAPGHRHRLKPQFSATPLPYIALKVSRR